MQALDLLQGMQLLRDRNRAEAVGLETRHPGWDGNSDARIAFFWRAHGIAQSAFVLSTFQTRTLMTEEWWKTAFGQVPSEGDLASCRDEVMRFIGVGLFHSIFSVLEAGMRVMIRHVAPGKFRDGTGSFRDIYVHVLDQAERKDSEAFFDVLRLLRNTIHNNGTYFSPNGRDEVVQFDGRTFEFRHGRVVDFRSWGFDNAYSFSLPALVHLAGEMVAIVESPHFAAPTSVPDPTLSRPGGPSNPTR